MSKIVYAKSKNSRISPRKARLIVSLLRGESVENMVAKLALLNSKAADIVKKVVESAIANATNNFDMDEKKLIVHEARVDEGFTFKRGKPVARGRYHKINRRNSHIIIGLKQND